MRLPNPIKGCATCRTAFMGATMARREVSRAKRVLVNNSEGERGVRYRAEATKAVSEANDQDSRYEAHHAEAHPIPPGQVALPGTDNDRAPSHRKPPLPPAADLAARLRAGETLEALCGDLERTVGVVRRRISLAGFNSRTGQMRGPKKTATDGLPIMRFDTRPWIDDALCAQTDPEAFFPDAGGSTAAAKRVCLACPVRLLCLEDALATNERFGVRGGLSERERRALKRRAIA